MTTEIIMAVLVVACYFGYQFRFDKIVKNKIAGRKKMSNKNDVRFLYLRGKKNRPIGTIAYKLSDNEEILYGVSACHSKDNWSKEMGRHVATERLNQNPYILPYSKKDSQERISMLILKDFENTKVVDVVDSETGKITSSVVETSRKLNPDENNKFASVRYRLKRSAALRVRFIQERFDLKEVKTFLEVKKTG